VPFEGTLFELETPVAEWKVELVGQDFLTVRANEKETDTGFAWDGVSDDQEFKCLTLKNTNLGDYNTGYRQVLFEVIDLNCTETIPVKRSEHTDAPGDIVDLQIEVTKKPCELVTCPDGEIQDLYMCGCNPMRPILGELVETTLATTIP
jgi:hypothetical protein